MLHDSLRLENHELDAQCEHVDADGFGSVNGECAAKMCAPPARDGSPEQQLLARLRANMQVQDLGIGDAEEAAAVGFDVCSPDLPSLLEEAGFDNDLWMPTPCASTSNIGRASSSRPAFVSGGVAAEPPSGVFPLRQTFLAAK